MADRRTDGESGLLMDLLSHLIYYFAIVDIYSQSLMFHAGGKEYLKKEWGASTWIDLPTLKNPL